MSKSKSTASSQSARHGTWHLSFTQRAALPGTPALANYLFRLMVAKQTNLCLSADVQTTSELLEVAEECGDSICLFKTHSDIVHDFGERTIRGLVEIAARKKFLIFEDRKFGDIGSTVQAQYVAGSHRIASWATIVNAHIFPGPAIITALKSAAFSAIAAYNTTTSTEISGGWESPSPPPSFQHSRTPTDKSGSISETPRSPTGEGKESQTDANTDRSSESGYNVNSPLDIPERPAALDGRKPSVVSINTTISSSTEYISSPTDGFGGNAVLAERLPLARGLLLLAQMSSEDNLFTQPYTAKCVELARQNRDFVFGFIAQESLNREKADNFIVMTPGVNMPADHGEAQNLTSSGTLSALSKSRSQTSSSSSSRMTSAESKRKPPQQAQPPPASPSNSPPIGATKGDLGQQYNTPRHVILDKGVDIIIVGRGILKAEDRAAEAERYRHEGWSAIQKRCGEDR